MSCEKEAKARIKINKLLEESSWRLLDDENGRANVDLEYSTKIKRDDKFKTGLLDYLLLDSKGFPLCVLEAKREDVNPLYAKEQARAYAMSQNIRFVILSNGNIHYLWDIEIGNPEIITSMPTQESLEQRLEFKPDICEMKVTRTKAISAVEHICVDTPIITGHSGGPIFDEENKVVGIATRGSRYKDSNKTTNNAFIKIDTINKI